MAKTENGFSGEIGIHYPLHVLKSLLAAGVDRARRDHLGDDGTIRIQPSLDQASSRRRFKQREKLTAKIPASITLRR